MELEEEENRTLNEIVQTIVDSKLKNGEINKDGLDGLEIGSDELKKFEDELIEVEPFKIAESVTVSDEKDENSETLFLTSNVSFVNDVIIHSIQLTTKITNLNEIIQNANLYEPSVTQVIQDNRGFKPIRYVVMKVDEEIDQSKAKQAFDEAITNPEKFCGDERYILINGKFDTINTPYNRDYSFKITTN